MSTKRYCDVCGCETDDARQLEAEVFCNGAVFGVQVTRSVAGVWNGGDVCHDCLRMLVALTAGGKEELR